MAVRVDTAADLTGNISKSSIDVTSQANGAKCCKIASILGIVGYNVIYWH